MRFSASKSEREISPLPSSSRLPQTGSRLSCAYFAVLKERKIGAFLTSYRAMKKAAAEQAIKDEFYANVREQAALLREIRDSMKK